MEYSLKSNAAALRRFNAPALFFNTPQSNLAPMSRFPEDSFCIRTTFAFITESASKGLLDMNLQGKMRIHPDGGFQVKRNATFTDVKGLGLFLKRASYQIIPYRQEFGIALLLGELFLETALPFFNPF